MWAYKTNLLNEGGEELDDASETILIQSLIRREQAEHVNKVVVYGIVLACELCKEHATHFPDLVVVVFDTLRHLA